ncbi:MAG: CDP-alcohol phosphatidyltransferase family protein [Candidatus Andeanibacterium colombiense]|uniref:CDP-alcohol phosphatidyltransferase family protein n=1 Tax=Candidatus Andeanibacterium colombiense TaxID=3121345 RepID=A0AAJ5X8N3_9SPHN|nr:MAG: CDP-alcohol phosphatidyltransferase family protein [Sphingomonadaceae bacterium]
MNAKRPPEVEGWLNMHIYHPLSNRLAVLLRPTGVTPNMVSVAGFASICAAGAAYTGLAWPVSAALGFLLHVSWHVIDGADGALARMTGKASAIGELVDGLCDYAGHVVLYVMLASFLADWIGGWAWVAATCAGASHIIQANHTESERRIYRWWAYGTGWIGQAQQAGGNMFGMFGGRNWITLAFGWLVYPYLWLSRVMNPNSAEIDAALAAAARDPALLERMRTIVRDEAKAAVLFQHLVGPNPRAIVLGIAMAFGSPLWFFLFTVGPQNVMLALSVHTHHAMNRRVARRLQAELAAPGFS